MRDKRKRGAEGMGLYLALLFPLQSYKIEWGSKPLWTVAVSCIDIEEKAGGAFETLGRAIVTIGTTRPLFGAPARDKQHQLHPHHRSFARIRPGLIRLLGPLAAHRFAATRTMVPLRYIGATYAHTYRFDTIRYTRGRSPTRQDERAQHMLIEDDAAQAPRATHPARLPCPAARVADLSAPRSTPLFAPSSPSTHVPPPSYALHTATLHAPLAPPHSLGPTHI
ncbi:hypothetical protein C8J57DRAFT_1725269 [Mycena rebaudengoi]|nr:hypothetical protein C8J57DRAFT_1725269 [Mycena rebaudengoi]